MRRRLAIRLAPSGRSRLRSRTASRGRKRLPHRWPIVPVVPAQINDELALRTSKPLEEILPDDEPPKKSWYILKVQSNREDSIRDGLQRRVAVAGLDRFFGDIIVPTEMVSEFKGGKKRVVKRKLYPGYLVVDMEINEETWFLVRETPGISDFTGSGPASPARWPLRKSAGSWPSRKRNLCREGAQAQDRREAGRPRENQRGDVREFVGEVDTIDEANGRVTVMINIFGRARLPSNWNNGRSKRFWPTAAAERR